MSTKFTFLRYTIYAALTYGLLEIMRYDAINTVGDLKFSETSLVEQLQNVFLVIALVFLASTRTYKSVKYILTLILGLFLIREQDAFLDTAIGEHSWKVLCGIFAAIIGYKIYQYRKIISSEIEEFIKQASSGIIFLGFITLLIFSRMFGRKKFWMAVENTENYTRNVKNAAEECTELFAYFLILIGIIEFFFFAKNTVKKLQQSTI